MNKEVFQLNDVGPYVDCHKGIYMGQEIISIAETYGMEISEEDSTNRTPDGEFYNELWTEAEDFLNGLCSEEVFFGSGEGCPCFLLMPVDPEEEL